MKLRVRDWPSEKDLDHYKCSCSKRLVAGSGFNHGSPTLYTMALGNWNDLDSIRNSCDVYIQGWRICLCKIFLLFSRWAEVTNTLHTKLVDEKTTDLCSLFMAPHNSKAPLSALRIAADALTFYARTWTNLDVGKWLGTLRIGGTLALAPSHLVWSKKLAQSLQRFGTARRPIAPWSRKSDVGETVSGERSPCCKNASLSVGTGHI